MSCAALWIVATRALEIVHWAFTRTVFGRNTCMYSRVRCTLYMALSGSIGVERSRSRMVCRSQYARQNKGQAKDPRADDSLAFKFQPPHRGSLPLPRGDLPFSRSPRLIRLHHTRNTPLILPDGCNSRTFGTCLSGKSLLHPGVRHACHEGQGAAQHPIPLLHRMWCVQETTS